MFDNISQKIKDLALLSFIFGSLASFMVGGLMMIRGEFYVFLGLLIIPAGAFLAWASSCLIYGFGELIDNTSKTNTNVKNNNTNRTLYKSLHNIDD